MPGVPTVMPGVPTVMPGAPTVMPGVPTVAKDRDHIQVVHRLEQVMGTVVTFDIYDWGGTGEARGYLELARARSLLQRYDAIFSLWKANSPMSCLRRGEIDLDDAPSEIAAVLDLCLHARELTHGWFDPFALPGGFDPTGLVKGWAAQEALGILTAAGNSNCMVNAGGDIATAGGPSETSKWRIGIRHPRSSAHLMGVVEVDGAIATSGTYERGAHLVDPHTGRRRSCFDSATVIGPALALADAAATALAVAGDVGFEFIEALSGYEAFAVRLDGSTRASTGWRFARGYATAECSHQPCDPGALQRL